MKTKLFVLALPLSWLAAGAFLWLLALAGGDTTFTGDTVFTGDATFTVNDPADATDAVPGDGVCETAAGNGVCTLRAAVQESNALAGVDTIFVPAGTYTLTIPGRGEDAAASGDLDVTEGLIIGGAGRDVTTIDGGGLDRVFHVLTSAAEVVRLSDLSLRQGNPDFEPGGGIYVQSGRLNLLAARLEDNFAGQGGAIYNGGTLTVTGVVITDNTAPEGGGLYGTIPGRLTVVDTLISSNSSAKGGGLNLEQDFGAFPVATVVSTTIENNNAVTGGGIYALQSRLMLAGSVISGNTAGDRGGGIFAGAVVLTVTETTIADNLVNAANGDGGGISANGSTVTLRSVTIRDNTVTAPDSHGGGLHVFGWSTIVNTTFSGNYAARGGAIRFGIGQHTLTNTTLADNAALMGGALYDDPLYFGAATLYNTIVAGNGPTNCIDNGQISSAGHNVDSGDSCNLNGPGDLVNTDPLLGPLQDNGGSTWTHALAAASPAIDAADELWCPPTDQRGVPRPVDGDGDDDPVCDIGAYEYDPSLVTPTPTATATPTATPTSTPTPTPTPTATATPTVEPPKPQLYLPLVRRSGG